MDEIFKNYEKTIKRKHSINFTPKYREEFRTSVNKILFIAIAEKAIEKLGWDIVYVEESTIEAKRKEKKLGVERWTEAITASYANGNIVVKSQSLGNEIWDAGKNSKHVKLFIYAFEETLKTFDQQSLKELEKEIERKNNLDDYVIPETLPKPQQAKTPNIAIPIIGGFIISLILGFTLASISVKGLYILFLFEFLVATSISFAMKYLIKFSNFTDFSRLQYILAAMIILTYLSNQYFQYEIILYQYDYERIGFWEFLKLKFSQGFTIQNMNTGWIGLVVSWIIQLGLTGLFIYLKIFTVWTKYVVERVPVEVVDFAYYHFVKGKTEDEVRNELAKKGWTEKLNQDEVLEAIGGFQTATEINRIK
ncbi:hypothetical protein CHRY9390_00099 [Chryseobacterium aquaeductus]|uniref:Uncharacterized protein n=1 Tax=Chryseobacterium aquaeductus TaxID=2675056 RepID=A0A9N8ME50_9FLAO|nr:hypothetical protein [Chryseobacterium aquaeductus]CAA7329462.1 hypothetical protein CHRY9390_00099 [Chryseobacterium potabilaquae]CAD7797033.1 hypothetical protein CHRY9390_00099 [Chryseobacterium aquaeductus]